MQEFYVPIPLKNEDNRVKYLVSKILTTNIWYGREPNEPVSLKAEYLKNVLGDDYQTVIKAAEKYIKVNRHYEPGVCCRRYAVKASSLKEKRVFVVNKDNRMIKRIKKTEKKIRAQTRESINGTIYKRCASDLKKVTIADIPWNEIKLRAKKTSWSIQDRLEHEKYKVRKIRKRRWYYKLDAYGQQNCSSS